MESFLSKKIFEHPEYRKVCEFAVIDEECYFCNHPITLLFNEHYSFCPSCSAIYAFPMVQKKNCSHVSDTTPVADHPPWFKEYRESKPYIYEEYEDAEVLKKHSLYESAGRILQKCSVCHSHCMADGF